jgi:hypothetical protein
MLNNLRKMKAAKESVGCLRGVRRRKTKKPRLSAGRARGAT